jgi:hypothetical protein
MDESGCRNQSVQNRFDRELNYSHQVHGMHAVRVETAVNCSFEGACMHGCCLFYGPLISQHFLNANDELVMREK